MGIYVLMKSSVVCEEQLLTPHGRCNTPYNSRRNRPGVERWKRERALGKNWRKERMRGCLGVWGLWVDYQESDGGKRMFSTRGKKTTADKTLKNILFTERCWRFYCLRYRGEILLIYSTHILSWAYCALHGSCESLYYELGQRVSNLDVSQNHLPSVFKAVKGTSAWFKIDGCPS